jgi:hypothetical protein
VSYNLTIGQLFVLGLMLILVVRIWMPWAPPKRDDA